MKYPLSVSLENRNFFLNADLLNNKLFFIFEPNLTYKVNLDTVY